MGYKAKKEEVERKIKIWKRVLLCVFVAIIAALGIFSAFVPPKTWKYHVNLPKVSKRKTDELRIHYLDVGQGDCTLIEFPDGKVAMIDGGNDGSSKTILRYFNALDINTIDCLILTHADTDHCGGLDTVLEYKTVKQAFIPNTSTNVNREYAQFRDVLTREECSFEYICRDALWRSTQYTFSCIYPTSLISEQESAEGDNNQTSAVVWLDYKGVSALFMGDAPFAVENTLIAENNLDAFSVLNVDFKSTEILKVAHHGSKNSTSETFLSYLMGLKTAIISCGKDNEYGHPAQELLQRLTERNAEVYRTDKQGHVVITISADGTYKTEFVDS